MLHYQQHNERFHMDTQFMANHNNLSDWRVLIVDDVDDNLSVVEAVMGFHGAEAQSAKNGHEALKVMETFKPNLILLDLSMPEMDGWELHQELRNNPDTARIPIIALTAHAMEGDKERVMEAGFTGYISKPFSVATLMTDIKQILRSV